MCSDTHQSFCFILAFLNISECLIFDVSLVSKTGLTIFSYKVLSVFPCVLIRACALVTLNMVNQAILSKIQGLFKDF